MKKTNNMEEQESIQIQIPEPVLNLKDIVWQQQGYELIGTTLQGMRFGIKIDKKLRLIGTDSDNKPVFKKIDM